MNCKSDFYHIFFFNFLLMQAMPEDERACYKQKAKGGEVKVPRRNNANAKTNNYHCSSLLTAQRVPVSVYEQEAREKEMKVKNMRRRIDNMIQEVPLMTGTMA